ncbi:MAG: carboxypeptidase-like regulatory domain-containing protein [Bacteroidales bacterium]|nr:carboxypeptidase-like regulatory domain-containing protein [Bacteroidales bacterium]
MHRKFRLYKTLILVLIVSLIINLQAQSQEHQTYIFDGHVTNTVSGAGVPLTHVIIVGYNIATITNEEGWFRLAMPPGDYTFQMSHLAYDPIEVCLTISSDTSHTFHLQKKVVSMEVVSIFAERIKNLTPETYSHVSDYEVVGDELFLIGHPGKRPQRYLYLAHLNGKIYDTLRIDKSGEVEKDYLGNIWYLNKNEARKVVTLDQKVILKNPISGTTYEDSIDHPILQWNKKTYFQDYFVGEKGFKTYFRVPQIDSIYIISTIRDSMLMYLLSRRKDDNRARHISDAHFNQVWSAAMIAHKGGRGSSWVPKVQSDYMTASFTEPLIYGTGGTGKMNFTIPLIKNITAPIFRLANVLVQIDYYNSSIYFFNEAGMKIHQVPIDFHLIRQAGGVLRQIFFPIIDYLNQRVYVWVQRTDHIEVYQLDVETGQLIKRINLESFQNVHNLKIENGSLFFLYNELHYPYATRLYRLDL